jgi:hypothetical protein
MIGQGIVRGVDTCHRGLVYALGSVTNIGQSYGLEYVIQKIARLKITALGSLQKQKIIYTAHWLYLKDD